MEVDDEQTPQPWDRQPGEPLLWYRRFTRFRLMEPVRSVALAYVEEHPTSFDDKERQKIPGAWYQKAHAWRWDERAAAWDVHLDSQIEEQIAAEEKKILRSHYALKHKRIQALDEIVSRLIGYLDDENNVWLPDVKSIGTGPNARQVDLVRFNDAIFGEIRGYLGDIAAEKGERVKKQEVQAKVSATGEVAIYLPQKDMLPEQEGDDANADSER